MIKEMDELLQHWADQHRGGGMRQCSPLGQMVEFGGIPPRSSNPKGSRDPLNLGTMDDASWEVEETLRSLPKVHKVMAYEHYRAGGYNDWKAERLGIARRTYYDRIDRLHEALQVALKAKVRRARQA